MSGGGVGTVEVGVSSGQESNSGAVAWWVDWEPV